MSARHRSKSSWNSTEKVALIAFGALVVLAGIAAILYSITFGFFD